jgi:hypothetical protein
MAQQPALPVIGYLHEGSPDAVAYQVTAFRKGLRLRAAKAATTTIPIVFSTAANPVQLGFVSSLNRPGGNLTGSTSMSSEISGKRFGCCMSSCPGRHVPPCSLQAIIPRP